LYYEQCHKLKTILKKIEVIQAINIAHKIIPSTLTKINF